MCIYTYTQITQNDLKLSRTCSGRPRILFKRFGHVPNDSEIHRVI